jgi:NIPSNAP
MGALRAKRPATPMLRRDAGERGFVHARVSRPQLMRDPLGQRELKGFTMNKPTLSQSHSDSDFVPGQTCCPIVELRQYTLHPGSRDVLIELFDREFVESQEAVGMAVIGQFRDLGDPNRFVWLRGFRDMPTRAQALAAFYGGPVWKAHREVANATMIDSDNVLLLRPARAESGFSLEKSDRPPVGVNEVPKGLVVATIYYFDAPAGDDFVDFFEHVLKPVLIDVGASILAYFVTDSSVNNFPALPVREGENVLVWFSRFRDQVAYERHLAALARSPRWSGEISEELARRLKGHPEVLKLLPTARSQLHD